MDLCHDASRISESLEGLKMKRESHRNSRGNGEAVRELCKGGSATALEKGKQAHAYIVPNRFEADVSVRNALISMYSSPAVLRHGTFIFDVGFECDISVGTALISTYARCGSVLNAQQVFDAYWLCDCMAVFSMGNEYSVELFQRMQQEGVNPDRISFVSVLNAFTTPTVLELGKFVQTHIIKQGLDSDVGVGNALINIFSRCGSLADACQVLDGMPRCDVVPWTAMISGYAQHQHAGYALHVLGKPTLVLFKQMQIQGVKPDNDTFVAVLSACSHADAMLCGTLLPACRVDCEVQLAEHAAHDLLKLDPQKASVYELLSKVYAAAGSSSSSSKSSLSATTGKCWHSTFGLISTSPGTPVCIFKNFQTCENCCIATMFISKLKAHENHYNGF
ncbi:unnamed protein product [Sphagnum tenellum]